jgi:hypothetical protein
MEAGWGRVDLVSYAWLKKLFVVVDISFYFLRDFRRYMQDLAIVINNGKGPSKLVVFASFDQSSWNS